MSTPVSGNWRHGFSQPVLDWFQQRYGEATPVQAAAWPVIASGKDALLAAPTGSGKTLAAFLSVINRLFTQQVTPQDTPGVRVLYVSPLKALSNDIRINLQEPLQGIAAAFQARHDAPLADPPAITAATWTGDTTANERNRIRRQPPDILVTTPESFYNLLTSGSGRQILATVEHVITDEIHAVAGNKRGAHLLLSLQRLEALCVKRPQRIAISATQKPVERMRDYILQSEHAEIIDFGHQRAQHVDLFIPPTPLTAVMSNESWGEIYDELARLAEANRTTLVFVNNRRSAERVAKHLAERLGEERVTAHHGSLAKEHRLNAEQRLKAGQLSVLVATASMELGIDIGDIDLVCQLGSAGSIQAFLQRLGRSGHGHDRISRGVLFPLTLDDLVELTALKQALAEGRMDTTEFPHQPLDVLAQQIVAEVAAREWSAAGLYALFRQASVYRQLTRSHFDAVLEMLATGYGAMRTRRSALLFWDKTEDRLRPRKAASLVALTNGGTIPDQFDYDVVLQPQGLKIGTLNEDFSFESIPGDIFQLGNHSYRILKVETGKVLVEDAQGQPPTIPFWFGVTMWRSDELSLAVSQLRQRMQHAMEQGLGVTALSQEWGIDESATAQLLEYATKTLKVLPVMPSQQDIVIERFFDENHDAHLVVHAPYGSRVNRAWGLALRKRFCRQFNFELQAAALEDSLILSLSASHSFPLEEVVGFLKANSVEDVLQQAVLDTPFFNTQWRWNASVALAIRRRNGGKRVPPQFQRNDAEDLVAQVFPDQLACQENLTGRREIPDHPLIEQTVWDCTRVIMDVDRLKHILRDIHQNKSVRVHCVDSNTPSPLALAIINARNFAFLDDAPAEERRTHAICSRDIQAAYTEAEYAQLNPSAVAHVNAKAFPHIRSVDELHEAAVLAGVLWSDEIPAYASAWLSTLTGTGRLVEARDPARGAFYFAAEKESAFRPHGNHTLLLPEKSADIVLARLESSGLVTFEALHQRLPLSASNLQQQLLALQNSGHAFTPTKDQWCERHNLARIRKLSIQQARRHYQAVSQNQWQHFLLGWQHVTAKTRLQGIEGLATVLQQLRGFSAPVALWEGILAQRVTDWQRQDLDSLCQSGRFVWQRAGVATTLSENWHSLATMPLTFVARTEATLLAQPPQATDTLTWPAASTEQRILAVLEQRGALFMEDISASLTAILPVHQEQAMLNIVRAGLIRADNFSILHVLSQKPALRYRLLKKAQRHGAPGYLSMAGRWDRVENASSADNNSVTRWWAQALLDRYGVVFKAVFDKEKPPVPWREMLAVLQQMEARGEILGGRFVEGFSGMQYALAKAASRLQKVTADIPEVLATLDKKDPAVVPRVGMTTALTPEQQQAE
jgi:ATP-dependent Lhr-like helicase